MASRKRYQRRLARLLASMQNDSRLLRLDSVEQFALHAGTGEQAPRFDNQVVYTGGIMYPEVRVANNYAGPVVVDVSGIEVGPDTPVNRDHDAKRPVAHCTSVRTDGSKLFASGEFSLDNSDSREITTGRKFPWKPSIGLVLLNWRLVREGETVQANGRTFQGPFLFVTKSRMKHLAILTEPGDDNVDPLVIAQQANASPSLTAGSSTMDFNAWVASLGLDVNTLSPEALAVLQAQYEELQETQVTAGNGSQTGATDGQGGNSGGASGGTNRATANATNGQQATLNATGTQTGTQSGSTATGCTINAGRATIPIDQFRATLAAETARADGLRALCARFGNPTVRVGTQQVNLAAHAISEGLSLDQCELIARRHQELEATRNNRPHAPSVHATSPGQRGTLETLQAGTILRAGIALDDPRFNSPSIRSQLPAWLRAGINDPARQRIMDQAQEFRSSSMMDMICYAHSARGHNVGVNRLETLHAAFSSGTVTDLFGATLGAVVLTAYAEIDDFTQGWTIEGENPDMEEHNRTQMTAAGDLSHHPVGGEADHATRTASSEKTKVERFSKQAEFDEADFMADNFGRLTLTPRDFGLAAGRVRPNLGAAVLLSNPTLLRYNRALFNTTDATDLGSGYALNPDNLSIARSKLGLRKDGDASLNLKATHLLLPPALGDLGIRITQSARFSNDSGNGEINPLASRNIKPVEEARLQNGMIDPVSKAALSGSATQYYLVSSEAHNIEFTYLEAAGHGPIVRTDNMIGGKFGVIITVRIYIGAKPLDNKGFVRGRA